MNVVIFGRLKQMQQIQKSARFVMVLKFTERRATEGIHEKPEQK
jgi:hypothetical protein